MAKLMAVKAETLYIFPALLFATGSAALSACLALSLAVPQSVISVSLANYLPNPDVYWSLSERALIEGSDLPAALRINDKEVSVAPNRIKPLLQRAFIITALNHGMVDDGASRALEKSYDLGPEDFAVSVWRARFAYNHWKDLTPELRQKVMHEHVVSWNLQQNEFNAIGAEIHDPAGRLAYFITERDAMRAYHAKAEKEK